jgi:hypothetical protein
MSDIDMYVCDECNGLFHRDEMVTLGGDCYIEGFAPEAYPACCEDCADKNVREALR